LNGFWIRHRYSATLLLALTAALVTRIPLLAHPRPYGDEILYALFGHEWLQGIVPYTLLWDVKPPGLFAAYAAVEAASGDAFLAARLLPLLATVAAAVGLWRIGVAWFGDARVGALAAVLYCVNTLALEGAMGTAEILFAPFVIFGVLAATSTRLLAVVVAGLLFGLAVTIKQTVAFEGALGLALLVAANRGDARRLAARILAYCIAGALPFAVIGLYFHAKGHFDLLWSAVVLSAVQRTQGDGVGIAESFMLFFQNFQAVLPLLFAAVFVWLQRRRFADPTVSRGMQRVVWWIIASTLGIFAVRAMYGRYLLTLVAPFSLAISALAFDFARNAQAPKMRAAMAAGFACLLAWPLGWVTWKREWPTGDRHSIALAERLLRHGVAPGPGKPQIFVVDHEIALYLLTDTTPPTRYAFPGHLECPFPLPKGVTAEGEIDRIMQERPRFVVISEPRRDLLCTLPERMAQIGRHLDRDYVLIDRVDDPIEPLQIFEAKKQSAEAAGSPHVQ
jgi:hypothetical protein